MAEHYSSQHDSVESVSSAYIAAALLAAVIVALSYALPLAVGAGLLTAAAVVARVSRPAQPITPRVIEMLRPDGAVADPPDSCPR